MDWSLVIFLVVVVFFIYRGYRKGLLRSVSRILSLLAGYIASILYAGRVSAIVESYTPLQGIVALITAALVLFIGAAIVVGLLFWIVEEIRYERDGLSTVSSIGGAMLGLMVGVIVAITIVWASTFGRDMYFATETDPQTQTDRSSIELLANRVASKAVNSAMSLGSVRPEIASLSVALIESPGEMSKHVQQLAQSNDLAALLNNPANQAVLDSGDVKALQALPAFQQLAKNPDMIALARSAGLFDESAGNTEMFRTDLARQLTDTWGRMQQVKNDRRVQEILNDPEFQRKVQSGNPIDLLTNPRLLELANIIFSDSTAQENGGGKAPGSSLQESPEQDASKKGTLIYSWTDKDGRVHYSDIENKP